jgi:hypothetical protein
MKTYIIKTTLLLFTLISFIGMSTGQVNLPDLIGKWKLQKVETHHGVILPKQKDFFLTISKTLIAYNLDVNRCATDSFLIDNKKITIDESRTGCTKVCCDGMFDTISNYLHYSGAYELHDSLLIITNDKAKIYLIKE